MVKFCLKCFGDVVKNFINVSGFEVVVMIFKRICEEVLGDVIVDYDDD